MRWPSPLTTCSPPTKAAERKWSVEEADAEKREEAAATKRSVKKEAAERKQLAAEAATKMSKETFAKKRRFAEEAAEHCHGDVALFNFMARLPTILG